MKKIILTICFMLIAVAGFSITGRDVMDKMEAKESPKSSHALVELLITESNGSVKDRVVEMWSLTGSNDLNRQMMVFRAPASVKNTRFLVKENETGDDKWIYMPALGKVRRIAASDGDSAFMGTEFTYDDMSGGDIDDDKHTLLREEKLDGYNCYVVESIPKDMSDTQYSRRVQWIVKDDDILMPIKVELYNKKNTLNKILTISKLENINGFWIPSSTKMENLISKRSSEINNKKIELNKRTNPAYFEKRFLTTGKVK
ncbi:MAG: outer membrane lipoprotein-sorting protein [Spirochaetaceae bacterium]